MFIADLKNQEFIENCFKSEEYEKQRQITGFSLFQASQEIRKTKTNYRQKKKNKDKLQASHCSKQGGACPPPAPSESGWGAAGTGVAPPSTPAVPKKKEKRKKIRESVSVSTSRMAKGK